MCDVHVYDGQKDMKAILTPFGDETGVVTLSPFGEEWIIATVEKNVRHTYVSRAHDTHSVRRRMEWCYAILTG